MCERPGPINIRCGCYDEVHELDPLILDNYSLEELQNQYHIIWKTARKQSGWGFEPDWPPAGYNVTYLKRNCNILSSLDLFIYNLKGCDELLLRILKEFTKTPDADTTMIGEIIEKHRTLIVEINEFHCPEDLDSEGPYRPITEDYYTRAIIYDICDWKSAAVEVLIKKSKEFYEQLPRIQLVKKIMVGRYESIVRLFHSCEGLVYRLALMNARFCLPRHGFMRNHTHFRDQFVAFVEWFKEIFGHDSVQLIPDFIHDNDGRSKVIKIFVTNLLDTVSIMYSIYDFARKNEIWPLSWRQTEFRKYLDSLKKLDESISCLPRVEGLDSAVFEEILNLRRKMPIGPTEYSYVKFKLQLLNYPRRSVRKFVRKVNKWYPPFLLHAN